jgi:hypothetical protein
MHIYREFGMGVAVCVILSVALVSSARHLKADQERKITEAEVPKAALDALNTHAGGAVITEFAEEIEHGHTFYEGSWKGPRGHIDVLVTDSGDLVEVEESISADDVPAAVRSAIEREAGKDAAPKFEKKTMIHYEVHFKKDGQTREMIFTPDGRRNHEESANDGEEVDDEND